MGNRAKYVIAPGYVRAKDGDWHFIGVQQLRELYDVDLRSCIIIYDEVDEKVYSYTYDLDQLTWLRPREDGNYIKVSEE